MKTPQIICFSIKPVSLFNSCPIPSVIILFVYIKQRNFENVSCFPFGFLCSSKQRVLSFLWANQVCVVKFEKHVTLMLFQLGQLFKSFPSERHFSSIIYFVSPCFILILNKRFREKAVNSKIFRFACIGPMCLMIVQVLDQSVSAR